MSNNSLPIYIVNFNTTVLTNNAILSIVKNSELLNYEIIIFDNSDKEKFLILNNINNIKIIDNTNKQIIDFDNVIKENSNTTLKSNNNFGSLKHCYTIDWIIQHETRNFLLFDSDIYLKHKIDFIDDSYITIASVCKQMPLWKDKFYPFIQYFNVKMIKEYNIKYFDKTRIMYGYGDKCNNYDTGTSFYDDIINLRLKYKDINYKEYINHLGGGSWLKTNNSIKINIYMYISLYKNILNQICSKNTKTLHLIMPDKNHIYLTDVIKDIILQFSLENILINDLTKLKVKFYDNYKLNEHHIKSEYYLKITQLIYQTFFNKTFDESIYNFLVKQSDNVDIIYNEIKNKSDFIYIDLMSKQFKYGNNDILRAFNEKNGYTTDYHRLFRGSHNVCHIINRSILNNNKLMIVTDSMLIPAIPILANYFKEILHIDNRSTDISFKDILYNFKPDYFISSHLIAGYVDNQYIKKLFYAQK